MRMKWILGATLVAGLALGSGAGAAPKKNSKIYVRVMSAKIMKNPQFIGAAAGPVSRGDALTFVAAKGDWYQVSAPVAGWLHKSNVSESVIKVSSAAGQSSGGASDKEVELAGRGFTPETEKEYRQANPNLDFSHVDALEKTAVDVEQLQAFVNDGRLAGAQ